jgi:hypothetical protein
MDSTLSPRAPRRWRAAALAPTALVLALVGPIVGVTVAAAPAGATPTCGGTHDDVDTVRVDTGSTGKVDFGGDPHLFGAPQGSAVVCWDHLPNGDNFVELDGQLYWDDLFVGGCAEIVIDFFDSSGHEVGASLSAGWSVKSPGGLRQVEVWRQAEARSLHSVQIRLFRSNSLCAGDVLVSTVTRSFGD